MVKSENTDVKGRTLEVYDYVQSGDRKKRVVTGHALLIPLERFLATC